MNYINNYINKLVNYLFGPPNSQQHVPWYNVLFTTTRLHPPDVEEVVVHHVPGSGMVHHIPGSDPPPNPEPYLSTLYLHKRRPTNKYS